MNSLPFAWQNKPISDDAAYPSWEKTSAQVAASEFRQDNYHLVEPIENLKNPNFSARSHEADSTFVSDGHSPGTAGQSCKNTFGVAPRSPSSTEAISESQLLPQPGRIVPIPFGNTSSDVVKLSNTIKESTYFLLDTLPTTRHFNEIVMTPPIFKSSQSNVCLGVNAYGKEFAIKFFNFLGADIPNFVERPRTNAVAIVPRRVLASQLHDVASEAQRTHKYRSSIEDYCSQYDDPSRPPQDALTAVRTFVHPLHVYALVTTSDKDNIKDVCMIMSRQHGDLTELVCRLNDADICSLCYSGTAQLYTELVALHEQKQVGHFDIKLENAVFHAEGQVKFIDFGHAVKLDQDGGVYVSAAEHGTLFSPEHFKEISTNKPKMRYLTKATDVWSLGITIAAIAGQNQKNPFLIESIVQMGRMNQPEGREMVRNFAHWREFLFFKSDYEPRHFDYFKIFNEFFTPLANNCPALFDLLMNHALEIEPSDRWSANDIASVARTMLVTPRSEGLTNNQQYTNEPNFFALRSSMRRIADSNRRFNELKNSANKYFCSKPWEELINDFGQKSP